MIGVPDARMGEELMAWVVLRDGARRRRGRPAGASAASDSRTSRCRATGRSVDEFPLTVTGKVQKFKMREIAIDELGLQSAASITTA